MRGPSEKVSGLPAFGQPRTPPARPASAGTAELIKTTMKDVRDLCGYLAARARDGRRTEEELVRGLCQLLDALPGAPQGHPHARQHRAGQEQAHDAAAGGASGGPRGEAGPQRGKPRPRSDRPLAPRPALSPRSRFGPNNKKRLGRMTHSVQCRSLVPLRTVFSVPTG
jgi:hypothetical protein